MLRLPPWGFSESSKEEMQKRKQEWVNPITLPKKGVLAKYAKSVKSASLGAITD